MTQRTPATNERALVRHAARTDLVERRLRPGWHPSAMVRRPSWLTRFFGRRIFGNVRFGRRFLDSIRDAAQQATIVYVLETKSLVDYLYFNLAFLEHKLPLARFANGVRTTLFRPWSARFRTLFQRRYPPTEETLKRVVEAGESALIFLKKRRDGPEGDGPFGEPYFKPLVDLAARAEQRILVVPLMLFWEKRSESYHRTLFDDVFGTPQQPGRIRKFFHVLKNLWESVLKAGSPTVQVSSAIDLVRFAQTNEQLSRNEKAAELSQRLELAFDRERRTVVGPPIKPAWLIRREILDSERVDQAVRHVTNNELVYPSAVKKRARKMIKEVAADFSLVVIKFLSATFNPIFDALYRGIEIDQAGLERVRDVAKDRRLVIIPSHKSHMDYLIISNVFYQHGLMPPHIAAGVNLSFWPVGPLFRRAGAFFLRRSFRGDVLYTSVFTEYLVKILREGFPVEFFIEGTRSRTGKLNRPRFGILSMMLRAALEDGIDRVAFVPVSVGYERIVEGRSYHEEMMGAEKQSENITGVLKATKVLRTKYGRVYVEFHDPIELDAFIAERGLSASSPEGDVDTDVRRLAYRIIDAINQVTTVTPSSVVATALLNSTGGAIAKADLLTQTGFIISYLRSRGARLSGVIQHALSVQGLDESLEEELGSFRNSAAIGVALEQITGEAVQLFVGAGTVKVTGGEGERIIRLDDDGRLELSYYRNNVVHFFVPDAMVATALASFQAERVAPSALKQRVRQLVSLFRLEFCFKERSQSEAALDASLTMFREHGWVRLTSEGMVVKQPLEPPPVVFLRRLLVNWFEGYWLVANCLDDLRQEPMTKREFTKHVLKRGRRLVASGEIGNYESLSKPTIIDAIDIYTQRGVLVTAEDASGKRSEPDLHLAPDYLAADRLRGVRAEIEQFLDKPLREVEAIVEDAVDADADEAQTDRDADRTKIAR